MKNIIYILILVCTLQVSISSCYMLNDNYLGNNCFYLPKYESIDVGYSNGGIIYRSSEEYVYKDIKIHEDVIKINYDSEFIIALQDTSNSSPKDTNLLCLYLIEKKRDIVHGPLNLIEYDSLKVVLQVPTTLRLD